MPDPAEKWELLAKIGWFGKYNPNWYIRRAEDVDFYKIWSRDKQLIKNQQYKEYPLINNQELNHKTKELLELIFQEYKDLGVTINYQSEKTPEFFSHWTEKEQKIFETKQEYIQAIQDLIYYKYLIKITETKDGFLDTAFVYKLNDELYQEKIAEWIKDAQELDNKKEES